MHAAKTDLKLKLGKNPLGSSSSSQLPTRHNKFDNLQLCPNAQNLSFNNINYSGISLPNERVIEHLHPTLANTPFH
jgi:hypothetical protein